MIAVISLAILGGYIILSAQRKHVNHSPEFLKSEFLKGNVKYYDEMFMYINYNSKKLSQADHLLLLKKMADAGGFVYKRHYAYALMRYDMCEEVVKYIADEKIASRFANRPDALQLVSDSMGQTGQFCPPFHTTKVNLTAKVKSVSSNIAMFKGYDAVCGTVNGRRFYTYIFSDDPRIEGIGEAVDDNNCRFDEGYADYCLGSPVAGKQCRGFDPEKSEDIIYPPRNVGSR
ncbi:hypothetical protein [Asticcacaulis sp. 201]|uniref:hypothetical protein n=1 Tax=Asticcacaulis sp. 201 TaxID=3028787 RepID=UPI002915F031|nr:hypothetical protein [Asticcacaulis sp. 201]MDV6329977.1 hypothetical protein [Asticcacaulis sp. 201]